MKAITTTYKTCLFFTLVCALLIATTAEGQDQVDWTRTYDNNHGEDSFCDIYAVQGGGYVTCGMSGRLLWLNKMANDGQIIWSKSYDGGDANGGNAGIATVWAMIESDAGNFLVGMLRNDEFSALLVDADGNQIWWKNYGAGICHSLIELKSGEFLMLGHKDSAYRLGRMVLVDVDGEVIWDRTYDPGGFCDLYYMRETEGGVIATGMARQAEEEPLHLWLLKISLNGDIVWQQHHRIGRSVGRGIAAARDGGFAITGQVLPEEGLERMFLMYTNNRGESQWLQEFDPETETSVEEGWSVLAPERGGYAVVGGSYDRPNALCQLKAVFTTFEGVESWKRTFGFEDARLSSNIKFYSAIRGHDNSILIAGTIDNIPDETAFDGFIVKLIMERQEPRIIYWEPHPLQFTVMPDSTVEFLVRAHDQQMDVLNYTWTLNQTPISNDTTVAIFFQELGEHQVNCEVSDGDNATSICWTVIVDDFFISAYTPDTLSLLIRRGTSVGFAIDEVKYTEGNDPSYVWTLSDLASGQTDEMGRTPRTTINFPLVGDYSVEGRAYTRWDTDAVVWNVMSRGIIFTYGPMEDTLVVPYDSLLHFGFTLTDPDNDDYYIRWRVNGELVLQHATDMVWSFRSEEGVYNRVRVIVSDRIETDTLAWYVRVGNLGLGEDEVITCDFGLLDVSPNPFNSMVTIRYRSTGSMDSPTRLSIHDQSGREVSRLVDGEVTPGPHSVLFDPTALPAGIYFTRLEAGEERATVKMVLVR